MATTEVGNVDNDNTSRPTPSSGSNGLDVLPNNPSFTGSGPNVNNFKREKEFPYNGSAENMNNSMDPTGNSSATKHRPNVRPSNVLNSTSPNNGPVPGGTMNPQPTGPPAPNVDPFSDGVNLPPDAIMNKGGMGYGMGPGAGGDAFGNVGGYNYSRNPNFTGMSNQLPPGNEMYQGPGAPSNPMPNSSYSQYDPMNSVRNFSTSTPVSRGYVPQYGPSSMPQPRASTSQRAPGTDRISSSAPTLSQLLQGQKPPYFPNNFSQQNDVSGRGGPDASSLPNQYWGGPSRSNPSMVNQMPVSYPNRSQINVADPQLISRRPYSGTSPMGPGGPTYNQQQSIQYMGNRQYPQMYAPQQMHRPPVSRGHYGPQTMPPPYGPQSQGMTFAQGQAPTAGFGSHVQPPSQEAYGQANTPVPQQRATTPAQPQQQLAQQQQQQQQQQEHQQQQQSQQVAAQQAAAQQVAAQQAAAQQVAAQQSQQPPISQHQQQPQTMSQQQQQQQQPEQSISQLQHQQQQLQQQQQQQQMPPRPQQQQQQTPPQQSYPSMQQAQQSPSVTDQQQQQQGNWPPHNNQQQQDVPSSQTPSQVPMKDEPPAPQALPASQLSAPPQASSAPSQDAKSQLQDQENANTRPSSLPDLSGCIDDLPTEGDVSNQTSSNAAPVNSQPVPNSSDQTASSVAPVDTKPKVEPGSNPPSQPPTPVGPPSSGAAVKPAPSPVGSPASLVSRTSQSPASANSGSVTPQPQMTLPPGNHQDNKGADRLSQSPSVQQQHPDMKGNQMPMSGGGYPQNSRPPPYGSSSYSSYSSMTRYPNQSPGCNQNQVSFVNYQQNPYGSPGAMGRPGFRGGPTTPYGTSSAMGNFDRIRAMGDHYGNSQQQCNEFNSNSMGGPGPDPAASMRAMNSAGGNISLNSGGNHFPPNYSGGGGPGGGGMGYKPQMPNAHGNVPQRLDGPYGGPNAQRFGMRGPPSMPPSSIGQPNMMPGDSRQPGSYLPPYPLPQQQHQQQPWPPSQQNSNPQQQSPMHHVPGQPFKSEVPYEQTNSFPAGSGVTAAAFDRQKPHQQPAVTTSSLCTTTQNLTSSSTHTSTTVISTGNSITDTRSTSVTQSITMPVSTPNTVNSMSEQLPPSQSPSTTSIIKTENDDGPQQIKMEANSLPQLPPTLNQPSPMASPSTLSKSSQEDVTSGTASPIPPSVGTPTPRPINQVIQQKKTTDGTSNGLVLNRKVLKLYELSDDPNRKVFLDGLLKFMDDRGQPIKNTPQVASHVLDLFRLYFLVKEKGGVVKVSKSKQWKQIASTLAIGNSNSAAYTLKKNYIRYLLPYECFYERNGLDPSHIIAEIDTSGNKKDKKNKKIGANAQPGVIGSQMFNNVPYDQYGQRHSKPGYAPYPNQMPMYPPIGPPRGPMSNNAVPQMPNNMGNNITVRDPFAEMDTAAHMSPAGNPAAFNANIGNNAYVGPPGGPMGPGQYRTNSMPSNEMYNQNMYAMRNSGAMPANSDPYGMGRRELAGVVGGKPEAFNRGSPMPGGDPYLGPNQAGSVNMVPSVNSTQQYQQGSHDRSFITPSPNNPPQQGPAIPPPMSSAATANSNSSSMPQDLQPPMAQPVNYRFPGAQGMGARASTPSSQTYPPPPYSGGVGGAGAVAMQYSGQPQQLQQPPPPPTQQQGVAPMTRAAPSQPATRFPDPNSSPFPQKRPADSFSPVAKRLDTTGPPQGPMPDGPLPNMPQFSQSGYFPEGERPHPTSGPPHAPGHPGNFPFGSRGSQPGPVHPQGMKRDVFSTNEGMGMHHLPSWGAMKPSRTLQATSGGMRGPNYSGPGTLQQALMGNYPRERYPPSKPVKQSSQLPTMSPHKKEVVFPPDSVEATQPTMMKVHMKTGKDVGSVEFWRVMMALKSGLIAESTWALDVLSVLLYDDSTVVSFDLKELKGLLELLVEYYQAVLKLIFGGFQNYHIDSLCSDSPRRRKGDDTTSERTGACENATRARTGKKSLHRTKSGDCEKFRGIDKSKVVKADPRARYSPLTSFYSESSQNAECESKHWSMREALPLRIINQFDGTVEPTQSLSQKYIREADPDNEEEEEWQSYCSEELRLVKDQRRSNTKLVYTSQFRRRPNEHVVVLEDEELRDDTPSMITKNDAQVSVSKRCKCISNILRGLSFIPANSQNFANHAGLLALLGRILLLDHAHAERQDTSRKYKEYDSENDEDELEVKEEPEDSEPVSRDNWSLDCLNSIREDALVIINNISGRLDFALYPEPISLPILDGLLHWSVCLSASALDPFPLLSANSPLTPKRLSVEALAKLSLKENNVDMILATPPFERLERLFGFLTQYVGDRKEPVLRELAIVLLSSLAQEETVASRSIACQKSAVSFLLCYLEDSEYAKSLEKDQNAAQFFLGSDIQSPNNNMMRRAASSLASLAKVPENHPLFLQHQTRLLNLSMSPLVDRSVRELIAAALFHLGSAGS